MVSSTTKLKFFFFKDAMRKVNERLSAPEVEVSDQEIQPSEKTLEIGTSLGELKTYASDSEVVPHVVKETLDELIRESVFVRQRLDK